MTIVQPARQALAARCRSLIADLRAAARTLGSNESELRDSLYTSSTALEDSVAELEQPPVQQRKAA